MAQTYTDPLAHARMDDGNCPECGAPERAHTGWGSARCSLTDTGVAQRIHQYAQDKKREANVEHAQVIRDTVSNPEDYLP